MRINNNVMALNAHRQLGVNQAKGAKSMEKLSSGLRINRAGDDAAGLAISEKMRGQIRGLKQATRNAQDGISLLQTAEGNLNETHAILQRMRELATQASNDTNVGVDREEIQKEINALTSEINRIGNTTEFNTQKLLNGDSVSRTNVSVTTDVEGAEAGATSAVQLVTKGSAKAQSKLVLSGRNAADAADANITFTTVDGGKFGGSKGTDILIEIKQGETGKAAEFNEETKRLTVYADINGNDASVTNLSASLVAGGFSAEDITVAGENGVTDQVTAESVGVLKGGSDDVKEVQQFSVETLFKNTGSSGENVITVTTNSGAVAIDIEDNSINDSSKDAQASAIADYLNTQSNFNTHWSASAIGDTIVMEQNVAGTGSMTSVETTSATATQGDYSFSITEPVETGGKFIIDGREIQVTDDVNDSKIGTGEAILVGASSTEQANNLAIAITRNADLKDKYAVSAENGTISLTQKAGQETSVAPEVISYDKDGKFEAKFQIGANTAQSMTIDINDMRSQALAISSAAIGTVKANDGAEASYMSIADVTDGTDNTAVEHALDVSDHDKATAAISVINDAIEQVSAERSKLGSFQNRLEHTISNLGTSSENLQAAEARIRDLDMAEEIMEFTKNNILQQAATAMLAQANMAPQSVLQLLG